MADLFAQLEGAPRCDLATALAQAPEEAGILALWPDQPGAAEDLLLSDAGRVCPLLIHQADASLRDDLHRLAGPSLSEPLADGVEALVKWLCFVSGALPWWKELILARGRSTVGEGALAAYAIGALRTWMNAALSVSFIELGRGGPNVALGVCRARSLITGEPAAMSEPRDAPHWFLPGSVEGADRAAYLEAVRAVLLSHEDAVVSATPGEPLVVEIDRESNGCLQGSVTAGGSVETDALPPGRQCILPVWPASAFEELNAVPTEWYTLAWRSIYSDPPEPDEIWRGLSTVERMTLVYAELIHSELVREHFDPAADGDADATS